MRLYFYFHFNVQRAKETTFYYLIIIIIITIIVEQNKTWQSNWIVF